LAYSLVSQVHCIAGDLLDFNRLEKKLLIAKTSVTYKDLLACLAEENTNKYLVENEIVRE